MNPSHWMPAYLLDTSNYTHGGLKLLFVEDSPADYELMCRKIRRDGMVCQTMRVDTLAALREQLEHVQWDLVISDHRLTGFGSEEVLHVVQHSGLEIPFLIVTGSMDEALAVSAMRCGADDYLMKDSLARLVPAIERSLKAACERRSMALAEQANRELERRLAAVSGNIPGVVFQMQSGESVPCPLVHFVSEGSLALFGVTPRVFLENPSYFFDQFELEDAAKLKELLSETERLDGSLSWEGKIKPRGERGLRWVLMNATGRASGNCMLWDGVLLDISERKRTENTLRASQQELRHLSIEFEKRQEMQRAGIAREIHDDLGASLTQLKTDIAWFQRQVQENPLAQKKLDDMQSVVAHLLATSQRISKDLRPGILDCGLVPALQWLVKDFETRSGTKSSFRSNKDGITLETATNTALFRILQEALTNIVKHAKATQVDVELFVTESELSLEIRDNGLGIQNADKLKQTSFGLRGMQERVTALDGWLDVSSASGFGTTVMVSIPT